MKQSNRLFAVMVLGLSATACSVLPNNPPVDTYRLAPSTVNVQLQPANLSLSIPMPYANRIISHQRLAVITQTHEVQAYHGVRWEDAAPAVFRDRLVGDFQRTHAYKTVIVNDENVNVDRVLRLDLQDYQLQYKQGQPYVVISVNATLINKHNSDIISSQQFSVEKQVDSTQLADVLAVFAQLNDEVNTAIIHWTRQLDR